MGTRNYSSKPIRQTNHKFCVEAEREVKEPMHVHHMIAGWQGMRHATSAFDDPDVSRVAEIWAVN